MPDTQRDDQIARAKAVPIESIIESRGIPLRGRTERVGACPVCGGDDRFSINTKKQVWNCRGCQTGGDVIELVKHLDGVDFLTACDTLAGPLPKANGKGHHDAKPVTVASFEYHDAEGRLLFVKDRVQFRKADGTFILKDGKPRKTFRQRRPDPDQPGQWLHNVDGVPVVPYRYQEICRAIAADDLVLVVEGEAKADLLASWGIAATCNAGGAKKWTPEHSEALRGAAVMLLPDNDDAGWAHMNAVAASLTNIAKSVRVVVLPHAKAKDDVIDWAKNGGTREQFAALVEQAQDWKPVGTIDDAIEQPNEVEKAKAKAREDELLDALAKASGLEYARKRKEAADELGVLRGDIDAEVRNRREDREVAPLYGHWVIEPSPDPVDGDALLRDIIRRIQRHVVITYDGALTIALWVMFAWVHDEIAMHSPILAITSTEPESGKSTTMGLIAFLMPKCIATVEASEAAIFRAIKRWQPSFCIDEFDSVLASDDKVALRSVINSGHTRGQGVLRCIGDDKVPELFSTFAPKAIGLIGRRLPPATLSRCVFVELRRRKKDEGVEGFAHADDSELADLRGRLRRWSLDNQDTLRGAKPSMPEALVNRRADNWKLQLSIADRCSGVEDFGDKARAAAVRIEGKADSRTLGVQLLTDIKALFDADPKAEGMHSVTIVTKLTGDPEKSWDEAFRGKPLTQNRLAKVLKAYAIISENVTVNMTELKGYRRSNFEEAWTVYVS
jgi:Protein of unknown function (DUF3631)/CHC2 zinc finger